MPRAEQILDVHCHVGHGGDGGVSLWEELSASLEVAASADRAQQLNPWLIGRSRPDNRRLDRGDQDPSRLGAANHVGRRDDDQRTQPGTHSVTSEPTHPENPCEA